MSNKTEESPDSMESILSRYEGASIEVQPLRVFPKREHTQTGCVSLNLEEGSIHGRCLDCTFFPLLEASTPCQEHFVLEARVLATDRKVNLFFPSFVGEALYRVNPTEVILITIKKGLVTISASPMENVYEY